MKKLSALALAGALLLSLSACDNKQAAYDKEFKDCSIRIHNNVPKASDTVIFDVCDKSAKEEAGKK